jgi:hypothetical protein
MVLAGLKPEVIMEICSRAMAFWCVSIVFADRSRHWSFSFFFSFFFSRFLLPFWRIAENELLSQGVPDNAGARLC